MLKAIHWSLLVTVGYAAIATVAEAQVAGQMAGHTELPASTEQGQPVQPPAAAVNNDAIGDIIVTAQRRSENLQNVPIAITALSGAKLSSAGIDTTSRLIQATPGLNFTVAAGAFAQPKIRGIGTSSNAAGIENPVATYVDGVYISSMSSALLTLNDIEQVAILKGPQGTLFGRNATGGLIQITTAQPQDKSIMRFSVGYSNLQTVTASTFLNGKLADDLSANMSVFYQNRNKGFGTNLFNGQEVYKSRSYAGRGKIRWQPGSDTTITLSGDYSHVGGPLDGLRPIAGAYNILGQQFTGGPFDVNSNIQPSVRVNQYGGSLTIKQDLGGLEIQSITARRHSVNNTNLDYDETPVPYANVFIRDVDKQFSQEFQIQPTAHGRFRWIAGLYYFWSKSSYAPVINTGASLPANSTLTQNEFQTVNSLAGYAQATFAIDDATNLTGGLRYTSDLRKLDAGRVLALPTGFVLSALTATDRNRASKLTYRASIDHRFSPELLAYASYNRGFKSGAYLIQSFPSVLLKPETLDAFEVGLKSDLLDRRVRVNLAAFYYDYKNIQIQVINAGLLSAYNGKGATFYGLDGDLAANVTQAFSVNAGASYLHSQYKSFPNAFITTPRTPTVPPPAAGPNGGNIITTGDATGNHVQAAPGWTLNVGGHYRLDVANGHADLDANFYHNGGWYGEADNRLRQPAYNIANASVSFTPGGDHLTVSLWGRNLFDKIYADYLSSADVADERTPAQGRTYGFTLSTSF